MVRSPCCDKMGLKKGPWTPQEDQVLVTYILQHGHGNWRALPKHAGLLRCGKSCRLRWTNYLRPDIKRGNFSREEEETIIKLHEQLGNKWSAIAAKLPGRTDNEIKNVWHTHLKKRLKKQLSIPDSKGQSTAEASSYDSDSFNSAGKMSPQPSSSDFSSGTMETQNSTDINNEQTEYSPESFPVIDESFWSDELSSDDSSMASDFPAGTHELQFQLPEIEISNIIVDDGMDFWYDVFIGAGGLQEL